MLYGYMYFKRFFKVIFLQALQMNNTNEWCVETWCEYKKAQ